jgi:hypothetical protein
LETIAVDLEEILSETHEGRVSEQLSADVKALLDRMGSHPRDEPLSLNMGIEIVELLAKVAAELEMLRGKPEGPIGW